MDFDINPYETDEERELRLRGVNEALGKTGSQYRVPGSAMSKPGTTWAEEERPSFNAIEPPTLDIGRRPNVVNADGGASTVLSMGITDDDGKEVLIPRVSVRGEVLSPDEAVDEYYRTGLHLGKYKSIPDSNAAGEGIHKAHERQAPEDTLGGTGGWGISAEELNAERAQRGEKPLTEAELAEGIRRGYKPRPSPQAPPKAEEALGQINAALEKTGSAHRVAPDGPPPVSRTEFNPKAPTKQLKQEFADSQNESLGNYAQKGELTKASGEELQRIYGEMEGVAGASAAEARTHVDQARAERAQFEAMANARLDKLAALVDNPPEESFNAGRAIMGAILSHGSNGRVSDGREAMAREMAMAMGKWKEEIAANRGLMEEYLQRGEGATKKAFDDAKLDNALMDMAFGSFKVALEREKANAQTEAEALAADEGLNILRQGMVSKELMQRDQQAVAAGKGRNKERERQILDYLSNLPLEQRSDAAMKIGPDAVELWKKAQGNFSHDIAMAKTSADAEKALREAKEGPGQAKMTDGDKKLARVAAGARPAYTALAERAKLIEAGKWDVPYIGIGPGATQMLADEDTQNVNSDIMQVANVLLRDESGANLPESEQKTKWASWGLTSPDQAVRNRGYAKMLAEFEGRVQQVAPVDTAGPTRSEAAPKPVGGLVRLVKGNVVRDVPSDMVDAYRAHGFRESDERVGSSGSW